MESLLSFLEGPWPWFVAGPLIGLMVPLMLWIGSRSFGISQNLEHMVAMTQPSRVNVRFFKYNWRTARWSLAFAGGVVGGGFLAGVVFDNPQPVALSSAAVDMFREWGFAPAAGLAPPELFGPGIGNLLLQVGAGILVGFGTRYASGCTSGHAITGLSTLQLQSLWAVAGIFGGGMAASWLLAPHLGA
jgi:uncharacterized membrane protein YedE/YeeE